MLSTTSLVPENSAESPSGASARGSHRLAAVDTCERLWALRYYWFYRQQKDVGWRLGGTLLHTAYQYYYASLLPENERPEWFFKTALRERLEQQARVIPEPERSKLLEMANNNLVMYMHRYKEDQANFKPIGIEEEHQATLGEIDPGTTFEGATEAEVASRAKAVFGTDDIGYEVISTAGAVPVKIRARPWPWLDKDIISSRYDLIYETPAGIWIMDYKTHGRSRVNPTTGRLSRWYEDGEYGLNWQVLINLVILRKRLGPRVLGFIIQRSTRQEPYDFDRHVLEIPQLAYDETPRVARELVKHEYDVKARIEAGGRPSPRFHACYGRYGPCDYREVCMLHTREAMLSRLNQSFTRPPADEIQRMWNGLRAA